MSNQHETVFFSLKEMLFEYDEEKDWENVKRHGISFKTAARVFLDYNRIELYDEENSILENEERYDTIGDISDGGSSVVVGNVRKTKEYSKDIIFVVYTERMIKTMNNEEVEITRIISARYATSFERGLYYGKYD